MKYGFPFVFTVLLLIFACTDDIGIPPSEPQNPVLLKISQEGNKISVVRKYVMTHDLDIILGPCGGNNLVQLQRIAYIPNNSDSLANTNNQGPTYVSATDWVGPYWMSAINNGNGNSGFTGGWHAYNGDFTGSPTARTSNVTVYVDGKAIKNIKNTVCQEASVVVENFLQAGNTKEANRNGREVLKEIVTYHFRHDTMAVSVLSEALEDLNIEIYYGLQSCFGGRVRMFCADSVFTCLTDGYNGTMARASSAECTMGDGHQVLCFLDSIGLGAQNQYNKCKIDTNRQYCFTSPYGKTYFRLVGEVGLPMKKGETCYWSGGYIFKEEATNATQKSYTGISH